MKIKKIITGLLAVGLFSLPAVADFDIDGQITQINDAKKTITIAGPSGNVEIQVFPYTELKGDDCGMFGAWDTHEKFSALNWLKRGLSRNSSLRNIIAWLKLLYPKIGSSFANSIAAKNLISYFSTEPKP